MEKMASGVSISLSLFKASWLTLNTSLPIISSIVMRGIGGSHCMLTSCSIASGAMLFLSLIYLAIWSEFSLSLLPPLTKSISLSSIFALLRPLWSTSGFFYLLVFFLSVLTDLRDLPRLNKYIIIRRWIIKYVWSLTYPVLIRHRLHHQHDS